MEFWNFKNLPFLTLFILTIATILFLAFLISFFAIMKAREDKYQKIIKEESNTLRIYSIDLVNNQVVYFTRSDISHKEITSLDNFYSMFSISDINKIRSWINDIVADSSTVQPYLEADILSDYLKKDVFSLLKFVDYSPEKKIIHLEMQLLNFITPKTKAENIKGPTKSGITQMSTLSNIINKSKSMKGFTFAIRFSYYNQLVFKENEEERMMILKLKDQVYPFTQDRMHPRYIIEVNDQELLLVDLKIDNRRDAYQLASSLHKAMMKIMVINDYDKYLKFAIGIVENKLFYRNFQDVAKHAQEASLVAVHDNHNIYFYERHNSAEFSNEHYQEQIDSVIKNRRIKFLYRPVVDVANQKVFGYLETTRTYGSSFTNYNEMMRLANLCGKSKEVFSLIAKNVIPKYADENPNPAIPLFYRVSIFDFENIQTIISQLPRIEKVHLVLVFEEQEISANTTHIKELRTQLENIKLLGHELALSMMDKNLLLDVNFYSIFDYFIAGTSMTGEIKKNNLRRLSIRNLIESLLKYKKPIIATSLDSWQSVELMIKSGVNYVSSEVISPSNEMILPVEKKKMNKLVEFNN